MPSTGVISEVPYENARPVALVTGGARRVGAEIVRELARSGFDIVFTYFSSKGDAQSLIESCQNISGGRSNLWEVAADLSRPCHAVENVIDRVASLGRLDLLVHNASAYQPDPPSAQERAAYAATGQAVHVESLARLVDGLAPLLRSSKGAIVTMLDLMAEKPMPGYATYCASKAALQNLTLSLARTLAPFVRVNGIAPGVVEWPEKMPEADREKYIKRVPLARAGTPQDVARLVRFLALEGTYITGQVIRLDGGRSIA